MPVPQWLPSSRGFAGGSSLVGLSSPTQGLPEPQLCVPWHRGSVSRSTDGILDDPTGAGLGWKSHPVRPGKGVEKRKK